MEKSSTPSPALSRIRQLVNADRCQKCSSNLTVERTDFFTTKVCENCLEHFEVIPNPTCCVKEDLHPVKYPISGGSFQVRNQCRTCGKVFPNAISVPNRDSLPHVDISMMRLYNDAREEQEKESYQLQRKLKAKRMEQERMENKEEWFKEYNKYLQSPEWQQKREQVLKRDDHLCQSCLINLATQVHHKSYEFVDMYGNEPCFDLVSICKPCHEKLTEMRRANRAAS